jgi:hypothetical protein
MYGENSMNGEIVEKVFESLMVPLASTSSRSAEGVGQHQIEWDVSPEFTKV